MEKNSAETDSDSDSLNHEELMKLTNSTLTELLPKDVLLRDLPSEVTLEEVNAQIALQFGRSMTVYVLRGDGEELPIVVPQGTATVLDLKQALRRFLSLRLMRQKNNVKLSWRYIWRSHWLSFEGQPLKEDGKPLSYYNIQNRCRVTFVKKLRERRK
ncbi:U11/U12 small nuclear ribonucleoprotein 25 kDa protein isoform X1 [Frankliniella occidentalis]|uniref:U11/U12 small nuclear ribonucleoprotein 25 kDa protein isoform X1 n=1 Tax=Frankliniella occidentalis TaxID=133901 RepID=A0A6J1TAB9_FRAOC|nr:U11/U12 small nuclear ribonucleoprotein 25 kDa protein isoform X1 [Frankliniella occidentalis]